MVWVWYSLFALWVTESSVGENVWFLYQTSVSQSSRPRCPQGSSLPSHYLLRHSGLERLSPCPETCWHQAWWGHSKELKLVGRLPGVNLARLWGLMEGSLSCHAGGAFLLLHRWCPATEGVWAGLRHGYSWVLKSPVWSQGTREHRDQAERLLENWHLGL